MGATFETLLLEKVDATMVIKINRPQALNALNRQVLTDLAQALDQVAADKTLRCLILTGQGEKAFVAGADIKEMEDMTPEQALDMSKRGQTLLHRIQELRIPSIAAVNGFALGGGLELALACDFIVASSNAKLGLPEVSLGLIPGYGGTQRLARTIGKSLARFMILTGQPFKAEEVYSWGLIAQVVPQAELMTTCLALAKTISSRGPVALSLAKRAINEGFDVSQFQGTQIEAELFSQCFGTQDKIEGVRAFIEKRPPQFTGQ